MATSATHPAPATLLRLPTVIGMVGVSKSQIYRLIAANQFPAPVAIGANSVAWPSTQVNAWIAEKIAGQVQA